MKRDLRNINFKFLRQRVNFKLFLQEHNKQRSYFRVQTNLFRLVAKIMERLPVELIELILIGCEAQLVAVSIPRVSKLFKQLTDDDSAVWKAKCEQKYLSSNSKDEDELSWKRHYFAGKQFNR